MSELKGKQADKFARRMLKVEKKMLKAEKEKLSYIQGKVEGYKLGQQQKADANYRKGKEERQNEIIEIIENWTFITMKNFSGDSKDFFKGDVNKLVNEIKKNELSKRI
jgi:hypothetical protein